MYNHAPVDYSCLFCCLVQKNDCVHSPLQSTDIIYQSDMVTAFVATRRFPNNPGHVLVIPNQHFENIYDLPVEFSSPLHELSRVVAFTMKAAVHCDGILIRQHNEPAGGQHIWHYHLHIIPRYENDDFFNRQKQSFPASERAAYAQKLNDWIENKERLNTVCRRS